jgi:hypothetical protein
VLGVPDGPSTLTSKWIQEFPVDPEMNGGLPRWYIGGIILKNDAFLVIAGSTRALGETYGDATGDDEDGLLTLLNPCVQVYFWKTKRASLGSDLWQMILSLAFVIIQTTPTASTLWEQPRVISMVFKTTNFRLRPFHCSPFFLRRSIHVALVRTSNTFKDTLGLLVKEAFLVALYSNWCRQ